MKRGLIVALLVVAVAFAAWRLLGGRDDGPGNSAARKPGRRGTATPAATSGERPMGVARRGDVDRSGVGVVSGRIVDVDGTPVTEGRVILHCLSKELTGPLEEGVVEVGPEGEFSGPGCRGIVCAEFRHTHLLPRDPWVLEPGERTPTLVARPLERAVGTVVDREGRGVPGAQVVVRRGADDDPSALPPFTSRNAVTDGEGFFGFARVERPPCDPCGEASGRCEPGDARDVPTYAQLVLVARAPGFRSTEATVSLDDDEPWQIELQPPLAPLAGTLTDGEGRAYPRARVLARSQDRGYEVHQARADGGQFTLRELGEGAYDLRAVQDGIELATARGHAAGDSVELIGQVPAVGRDVVLEVVHTGSDDPVSGAVVDGGPFAGARTDPSGVVRAEGVLPGTYPLGIRVPGLRSQRREFVVSEGGDGPFAGRIEVASGAR